MKFHIDQVINCSTEVKSTQGDIIVQKERKFVVAEVKEIECVCTKYTGKYVYFGLYDKTGLNLRCVSCNKVLLKDPGKIWVPESYFDAVVPDIEKMEKMEAELFLLKMLANKTIPPSTYTKVMNMINGDDEMLELGRELLKNYV